MTRTVFLFAHHRKTFPMMKTFRLKRNSTRAWKDRKCVAHGMNKRKKNKVNQVFRRHYRLALRDFLIELYTKVRSNVCVHLLLSHPSVMIEEVDDCIAIDQD